MKNKSKFLALILIFAVTSCTPPSTAAPPRVISVNPISDTNLEYVNFSVDRVIVLGKPGDIAGEGEFRLFILAADNNGHSSGTFCPAGEPIKIHQGSAINSPCAGGISFREEDANDVLLMVFAVDEDKSTEVTDLAYEGLSNSLAVALVNALDDKLILHKTGEFVVSVGLGMLTSYLVGKAKEWAEKADIIGSMGIYLVDEEGWNEGEYVVLTGDERLQISYKVSRTINPQGIDIAASSSTPTITPTLISTPLPYTETPTIIPTSTPLLMGETIKDVVWLRAGPGENYHAYATYGRGLIVSINKRSEDGNWLVVVMPDGGEGWVSSNSIQTNVFIADVSVATPPPTETPMPTATPGKVKLPPGAKYPTGDINKDCVVDIFDYNIFIGDYGKSGTASDLNGDGVVDDKDYDILMDNFGATC